MVWPIPSTRSIFARIAAAAETGLLKIRPDADPRKVSMAVRSERGVFAQLFGAIAPEIRETHDHQAWWGRQYFPDSADDEAIILRHADIWGIVRRSSSAAVGRVEITGTPGVVLESGIELMASSDVSYATTAGGTINAGGTLIVAAIALTPGLDGNIEAGVILSTVSAEPDISKVTVITTFAGGADEETPAEIQVRYLQRIREPPMGGSAPDYKVWIGNVANIYAVSVVEDWIGLGSIGVVIALQDENGDALVPTEEQLTAIGSYLGEHGSQTGVRPVTARVIPVAAELVEIPISVTLRPDTALTRAAVEDAFIRFIKTIGDDEDEENASPIGATIEPSRISEAISAADGEYSHDLVIPAARYTLGSKACPIAGPVTFL